MKKTVFIGILCTVVLWIAVMAIDFSMVSHGRKPLFCVGRELADDGGTGKYVGLGYFFDLRGSFMPEDNPSGVTAYRGYLFGVEIVSLEEAVPETGSQPIERKKGTALFAKDAVLKKPPVLTVTCGEACVEALMGTTSWTYQNADGTGQGLQADSLHPLESRDYMTPLVLSSSADSVTAFLQWNPMPDKVTVRRFEGDSFGDYDADGETIPVSSDGIELKNGVYIYEVVAEWNASEKWGGMVHYGFYTVKTNSEFTEF